MNTDEKNVIPAGAIVEFTSISDSAEREVDYFELEDYLSWCGKRDVYFKTTWRIRIVELPKDGE